MSEEKRASQSVSSPTDMGFGSSKPAGFMDRLKGQKIDLNDVGREYFEQSLQYDPAQLARDAVKVRRKLDFMVLPMVRQSMR